ncbi:MAG: glycosyltransferase [Acetobacteraceae bacterium]|nr:glycosyltransferase [Acetobacteraceae bacterium]
MKFLFVHQNFPAQYQHLIMHLLARGRHEVVFISEANQNAMPGVRRVLYQSQPGSQESVHPAAQDLDRGVRRAELVAAAAANLKRLGFTPDIIIGHHGWGEMLNLVDVYPGVPMLGYFEFYYWPDGQDVDFDPEFPADPANRSRIRTMNVINHLAFALEQPGQTPTKWQQERYPDWMRPGIDVLPEGALLDRCRPDPKARRQGFAIGDFRVAPGEKLVTFVARNLEPYRGAHTMIRALPGLLRARRDVKVVMVGGDDVSYGGRCPTGSWREHFLKEIAGRYDPARVLMPGQIAYDLYVRMLQRSDAHVYLTYPFVASWSLREALATGCAVIGAEVDPVREFITDNRNGLLTPCLDPERLVEQLLRLLEDRKLADRLGAGARRYAERHLDMKLHIAAYARKIHALTGQRI